MSKGLTTWAIYDHPADYPDHFVVRSWRSTAGRVFPGPAEPCDSLEQARELLPPGLYRIDRQPDDDPTIIEVWL